MNHFLFLVIPVHANQLDSGVLLVYSALFCFHSASFRYIPVPFRYHSCLFCRIPVPFGFIPDSFCLVPAYSGICRFICVSLRLIPVSFRCHSASFRYNLFRYHSCSFQCHSSVIPPHSGIFRFIPVYSVPFCSCV